MKDASVLEFSPPPAIDPVSIPLPKGVRIRLVRISPEAAARMLEKNGGKNGNRPCDFHLRRALVRALLSGQFVFNGMTIVISDAGCVLNGQHRLRACVESGVSIDVLLVEGLPESVITTIDVGKARSTNDVMKIGYGVDSQQAATAILIDRFERRLIATAQRKHPDELAVIMRSWGEDVDRAIALIGRKKNNGDPTGSSHAWAPFAFARPLNPTLVDEVAEQYRTGEGLTNPMVVLLREQTRKIGAPHQKPGEKVKRTVELLRGIVAIVDGDSLSRLAFQKHDEFLRSVGARVALVKEQVAALAASSVATEE